MNSMLHEWLDIIKERAGFFSTQLGCILIDSGFIGIWAIIDQAYHKYVVVWLESWFHSTITTKYLFPTMKIFFDLTTLAIVMVFLYADFKRIAKKIREIAKRSSPSTKNTNLELDIQHGRMDMETANERNVTVK